MKYAYYPGCSGGTTAREYNESAVAVSRELGIELVELDDWSCCGASSAHSTNHTLSHSLTGRNLAIAEKQQMDTAVICPACYVRLRDTYFHVKNGGMSEEKISGLVEMPYGAKYGVDHLLDIMVNTVGLDPVRERVTKPLKGLKVVSYYGCYLVRPRELTGFDDTENPVSMDRLLEALGAEVLDWSGKIECCSGSGSFTDKGIVKKLVGGIIDAAREVQADLVVTACGLCQANLETRQSGVKKMPAAYFTELMGLAFGLDAAPWFKKHMINPVPVLKKQGLI